MTRILAIANPKGGVGKTTTTLNLGAALAARGARVLLIDLDPQAGLTLALGQLDPAERPGFFGVVTRQVDDPRAVIVPAGAGLALVPACAELAYLETRIGAKRDAVFLLRTMLQRVASEYDIILIDTPPGVGLLTANALVAAEGVIIPVQAQLLAMYGVRTLLRAIRHVRAEFNPALRLSGLLATMVLPQSPVSREVVSELRAVFPRETFEAVIPFSETLVEAQIAGRPVQTYAPGDPAASAYAALAEEIGAHD